MSPAYIAYTNRSTTLWIGTMTRMLSKYQLTSLNLYMNAREAAWKAVRTFANTTQGDCVTRWHSHISFEELTSEWMFGML